MTASLFRKPLWIRRSIPGNRRRVRILEVLFIPWDLGLLFGSIFVNFLRSSELFSASAKTGDGIVCCGIGLLRSLFVQELRQRVVMCGFRH